jgi:hypothetical protein
MTDINQIPTGFALNQLPSTYDNNRNILTGFNDIFIDEGGNLAVVGGTDDLLQTVKNALWLWIGEYDYDITIGLSYRGIFSSNAANNVGIFTQQIEDAILQCNNYLTQTQLNLYGINQITDINFTADRQTRTISISVVLSLNNGANINLKVETE